MAPERRASRSLDGGGRLFDGPVVGAHDENPGSRVPHRVWEHVFQSVAYCARSVFVFVIATVLEGVEIRHAHECGP